MSNENHPRETDLSQSEERKLDLTPVQPQEVRPQGKSSLIKSVGDFFGSAFGGGKNQDLGALMEEFTSEMTLVAEGLSQDQDRLNERCARLEARQTESEERLHQRLDDVEEDLHEQRDALRDLSGQIKDRTQPLEERLDKAEERLKRAENVLAEVKKAEAKKARGNEKWGGTLRQVTILAAIVCGAWVLTTIINKFF